MTATPAKKTTKKTSKKAAAAAAAAEAALPVLGAVAPLSKAPAPFRNRVIDKKPCAP